LFIEKKLTFAHRTSKQMPAFAADDKAGTVLAVGLETHAGAASDHSGTFPFGFHGQQMPCKMSASKK
jgi:hypothetical protein